MAEKTVKENILFTASVTWESVKEHFATKDEVKTINDTLAGKAPSNHIHDNYSLTSHTHSYLPLSGGSMNGRIYNLRN